MELIKKLTLLEGQNRANRLVSDTIAIINDTYNEWKKIGRRRNAVDIVTTSINRIAKIDDSLVPHLHDTARVKLAVIIMRCLDVPPWMNVDAKRIIYNRAYHLTNKLQRVIPNTGTNGTLNDVITTRFSASISNNSESEEERTIFVAYEPRITKSYLRFIFGEEIPTHVVKMQTLSLPEDFDTLIDIIKINQKKACERYLNREEM